MRLFPVEIQYFGRLFVSMQGQRQQADYSPSATFGRDRVLLLIAESEQAIAGLESASNPSRRALALHVLMRRSRE